MLRLASLILLLWFRVFNEYCSDHRCLYYDSRYCFDACGDDVNAYHSNIIMYVGVISTMISLKTIGMMVCVTAVFIVVIVL